MIVYIKTAWLACLESVHLFLGRVEELLSILVLQNWHLHGVRMAMT